MQFMMPQGSRSRVRRDEMRTIVAHVYRLVAADLRPTTLQEDAPLRIRITDWIMDTLKYLQAGIAGTLCQAALVTSNMSLTCWPAAILCVVTTWQQTELVDRHCKSSLLTQHLQPAVQLVHKF